MYSVLSIVLAFMLVSCPSEKASDTDQVAIVGGTIIDISNGGSSTNDIVDSVVLIEGDEIKAVGRRGEIQIPEGSIIIDAKGKYILPGLIDAFATLNNQSYANAFLYMGVTTIVSVEGGRRGELFEDANPGPGVIKIVDIGHVHFGNVSTQDALRQLEESAKQDYRIVLLMYELRPYQLKPLVDKAHELGMGTIGELGYTLYREAIETDIDAFVHTSRYSLDLAPPELIIAVAEDPFGMESRDHLFKYGQVFMDLKPEDPNLLEHASILGNSQATLIPTLSIICSLLPDIPNPWEEPVAKIINPEDIHMPLDRDTGKRNIPSEALESSMKRTEALLMIEKAYCKAGARYLAGSGTDAFGTMPGISLHTELKLLTRIGLSNREAIAAATSNFAEAFGWEDIGLLEPGYLADIIVVNADPLDDLENLKKISILIKSGRIIDREALLRLSSDK